MRFLNRCALGMLALSCAPLWGCTSGTVPTTSSGPVVGNGATVSQPVSSQGGTVTLQGSTITIPPGALAGNQTISIVSTTTTAPAGVTNLSPIYQFGPAGLVFNKPVTIQLNFISNGSTPAFAWTNPNSTTFGILPSSVSGSAVSAQVTHFSQGFVADGTTVANLPTGTEDAGPPTGEDSGAIDATTSSTPDATVPPADATTSSEDSGPTASDDSGPTSKDSGPTASDDSGPTSKDSGPTTSDDSGATTSDDSGPTTSDDSGATTSDDSGATTSKDAGATASDSGTPPSDASTGDDASPCAVCSNGFCEPTCPAGSVTCSGSSACISIESDPDNCGACGHSCNGGACLAGECVASCYGSGSANGCASGPPQADGGLDCASCGTGFQQCGDSCIDTTGDINNCGTCGNACGQGQTCSGGTCAPLCTGGGFCASGACVASCPTGTTSCTVAGGGTGLCANTQTDPANCGSCGHSCADGLVCFAGSCVASCSGGSVSIGGAGEFLPDGGIECSSPYSACGSECTDLQNDPNNCGNCGTTCSVGQTCSSGACGPICAAGDVCTTQGACAAACPTGQTECVALGSTATSRCNDLSSDPQNCGTCGHTCASGQACISGACVATCGGADAGTSLDASAPSDGGSSGGCISTGCQSCGQTHDNCGNPINCGSCGGGDGGSGGCVSTGCQGCGSQVDNCGNKISCAPCGGGSDSGIEDGGPGSGGEDGCAPPTCPPDFCGTMPSSCGGPPAECTLGCATEDAGKPADGGSGGGGDAGCAPPKCPPTFCGSMPNSCGVPVECSAGCSGDDAGVEDGGPGGGGEDAGCTPPKCPPTFCGSMPNSCGAPVECSSGCTSDDAGPEDSGPSCGTNLLTNPVVPASQFAGVSVNANGTETVSYATFAQTNCAGTPTAVTNGDTGVNGYSWGPEGDIYAEFNQTTNDLYFLQFTGKYAGQVQFHSRPGGAFGNHEYALGLNTIQRDGEPFSVDWSSYGNADIVINELYDGLMATFAPTFPVIADCGADGACLIVTDDGSNPDGGVGNSVFGFRPLKLYFYMPGGTSNVNLMYTFLVGPAGGTEADGGPIPGTANSGGLPALGTGCAVQGALGGTCETPTSDLCSNHPGTSVTACQNDPLSGYTATCCPDDGG